MAHNPTRIYSDNKKDYENTKHKQLNDDTLTGIYSQIEAMEMSDIKSCVSCH